MVICALKRDLVVIRVLFYQMCLKPNPTKTNKACRRQFWRERKNIVSLTYVQRDHCQGMLPKKIN